MFRVPVFDGQNIVAMARMIGDMGLNYYIKDVVVKPEYQHKCIGKMLIDELLKFVKDNGIKGTNVFVKLYAMPDKIPFYEKQGFSSNEAQRLKLMYEIK
ncbi:MAG: GNAT family N-acetyltransferase [Ruminococcus flavefaciens]|nr:GNAT family N-acetyltransferase [Ruminococcus flavefaciens]